MQCVHCNQEHPEGTRYCPVTGKEIIGNEMVVSDPPKMRWQLIIGGIAALAIVAAGVFFANWKKQPIPVALATMTTAPTQAALVPTEVAATYPVSTGPAACQAFDLIPTPDPTVTAMFPPITAEDWSQGLDTASITFLEYSDFQ
jgi:hypothetical protein